MKPNTETSTDKSTPILTRVRLVNGRSEIYIQSCHDDVYICKSIGDWDGRLQQMKRIARAVNLLEAHEAVVAAAINDHAPAKTQGENHVNCPVCKAIANLAKLKKELE